ncbi:MAG TPA: SCO family protein [Pyrinomonadaceae bacterium]|nr:SCO family protein [Pyrinomonadaceae bacterium]
MTNTRPNENNRRPLVRFVAKLSRLASLVVVVAAICGSLDAADAQTTGAKQPAQTQAQKPQAQQPQPKTPAKPSQPASVPAPASDASAAQKYFTDVELINQNGERMRLYSDVIKNHVVVVNAFFATCQGSCLPMNRNLEKLQAAFKERMGKDLYIVSISVDPTVDTPQALKEYARKLNAAPGRLFLTGKKENVDWALYKLGQYVEQREQHTNIFIIGNERTGLWKKAFGLAQPEELVKIVESVLNDAPPATGGN